MHSISYERFLLSAECLCVFSFSQRLLEHSWTPACFSFSLPPLFSCFSLFPAVLPSGSFNTFLSNGYLKQHVPQWDLSSPLVPFLFLIFPFKDLLCIQCFAYIFTCRPGEGTRSHCEPPCGCLELNSGPLEEQPLLITTEPSLKSLFWVFCLFVFLRLT